MLDSVILKLFSNLNYSIIKKDTEHGFVSALLNRLY